MKRPPPSRVPRARSLLSSMWLGGLLLAAGCEMLAFADRREIPSATGGGGAGGESSGAGAGEPCLSVIDCPDTDTDCARRSCVEGRCAWVNAPAGKATQAQLGGDCHLRVCDGAGACPADSFEPAGTACGVRSEGAPAFRCCSSTQSE